MKRFFQQISMLAVLSAIVLLTSCGGKKVYPPLTGLAEVFEKYESDRVQSDSLDLEAFRASFEEAAKKIAAEPLQVENGQFEMSGPLTLKLNSVSNTMIVRFSVEGSAKAAADYPLEKASRNSITTVYLQGLDNAGNVVFSSSIGNVAITSQHKESKVEAGSQVHFMNLGLQPAEWEAYKNAETFRLSVD